MRIKIIMDFEEWGQYLGFLKLPVSSNFPQIPPSFPVIVITEIKANSQVHDYEDYEESAFHSFIERDDLKRFLGLPVQNEAVAEKK